MKNFIKYIFLFLACFLFLNGRAETYILPVDFAPSHAVESISSTNDAAFSLENGNSTYSQLQKSLWDCTISSINSKNNNIASSDNKCSMAFDGSLPLKNELNYLKYIVLNFHRTAYILENAVIARAP